MDDDHDVAGLKQLIDDLIAQNRATAPTEPGLYRMPCGECYVDFFIDAEGKENWLVPGDPSGYTRETVVIARHGEHPWERMYTLRDAAQEIERRARPDGNSSAVVVADLASDARDDQNE